MKQTLFWKQLKNTNKENGKRKNKFFIHSNRIKEIDLENERRICNSTRIFTKRLSFGKKDDANSTSCR